MKKIFYLILLIQFLNTLTFAQTKVQKLYKQAKYDKCIKVADRYIKKKKAILSSQLYKSLSLIQIPKTEYASEYKYPYYSALKCIYKIKRKDKKSIFFEDNKDEIEKIITIAENKAVLYKQSDNRKTLRKAMKIFWYLNRIFPQEAKYYFTLVEIKTKLHIFSFDFFVETNFVENVSKNNVQTTKAISLAVKFAENCVKLNQYSKAIGYYELVCKINPLDTKTYLKKATCFLKINDNKKFDAEIERIVKIYHHFKTDTAHIDKSTNIYFELTDYLIDKKQYRLLFELMNKERYSNSKDAKLKNRDKILLYQIIKGYAAREEAMDTLVIFEIQKYKTKFYPNYEKFDDEFYKVVSKCYWYCELTEAEKKEMLNEVNKLRIKGIVCGEKYMPPVKPLKWGDCVANSAQLHAKNMYNFNFFSHTSINGDSPSDRTHIVGCELNIGENIALGYENVKNVVFGWRWSTGHCKNIMNSRYTELGAGRAGTFWVQNFN